MGLSRTVDCTDCPSSVACGAMEFRPVAAAFRQLRDYVRTVGPGGANCMIEETPSERALRRAAASLAVARKKRNRILPAELLGEPAWDILLELFSDGQAQSMKSLSLGTGVPLTTTLRWVSLLDQQDLLQQYPDPSDARRTMVRLTAAGEAKVAQAVSAILEAVTIIGEEI